MQIVHMQPLVSLLCKSKFSKLLRYNLLYRLSLDVILLGVFGKNNSCVSTLHCTELSGRPNNSVQYNVAKHELFLPKNPNSITSNDNLYNKF